MNWLPPTGDISNILNGNLQEWFGATDLFSPSQLAQAIINILQSFITLFSYIWNLFFTNILTLDFTILGLDINLNVSLFILFTIGGFFILLTLKIIALIPIIPD